MNNKFVKLESGIIAQIVSESRKVKDEKLDILEAKTADVAVEKHVPYIQEMEDGYLVKVGKETTHPMTEEHWIEFIELEIDNTKLYRYYLKPVDTPEAYFKVPKGEKVVAREYCNLHGLWESKL